MDFYNSYLPQPSTSDTQRRQSNDGNNSSSQVIATSTPNLTTLSSFMPIETLAYSPISTTGSASVLDWNSNSDSEFLELDAPQVEGAAEVNDTALQPQTEEWRSSSTAASAAANTMTTTVRRVSLEEIAVYQFDSFPSSPSSLSASLSPAASAPLNVRAGASDSGVVNDLSSDTILAEEVEQPRQITEKDVGEGLSEAPLKEDEAYHTPLTMSVVAQTSSSPTMKEAVESWKATLSSQSDEPAHLKAEPNGQTTTEPFSPTFSDNSQWSGDDLVEQPSTATVTQNQVHQSAPELFTCSLFEPPSKTASPSGSRLSYMSEPSLPSIMAGPSSMTTFLPPISSNPWYREATISSPQAIYSPTPLTATSAYQSRSNSPYPHITPLGRIDTPGSFFSPLLPPAQLESPRSILSPPLLAQHPSNFDDNSPSRTASSASQDSQRSFNLTDSPRSIVSPPMPLPPTPPMERRNRRSPDFYGYHNAPIPLFPNALHQVYGRFSPEDDGAVAAVSFARLTPPSQALPKTLPHPGLMRSVTEIPSWLKTSGEEKSQSPRSLPSRPMFSNTSSSSILTTSSSRPRPPLPPLPFNTLPHGVRGPEAPLPTWPASIPFTFSLNRQSSPPARENSSDTMRSVPLLSPPAGYATLPGGVTSSNPPARVYSYSPTPSRSPPYSPASTEGKSVYESRTPSPAPHHVPDAGDYRPTYGTGAGVCSGPGSLGSLTGPPLSAQRRLRFAPLPPTPGSSLRASVFTPSPYPSAHSVPLASWYTQNGPTHPPATQAHGGVSNGSLGLATATYAGGGGQHHPQPTGNGVPCTVAMNSSTSCIPPVYPQTTNYGSFSFPNQCPYRQPVAMNPLNGLPPAPSSAPATSGNFTPLTRFGSCQQANGNVPSSGLQPTMPPVPPAAPQQHPESDMKRQLDLLQQVADGVPPPLAGRAPAPPVSTQVPMSAPANFPAYFSSLPTPALSAQGQRLSNMMMYTPPAGVQMPRFAPQTQPNLEKPGLMPPTTNPQSIPPMPRRQFSFCSVCGRMPCFCQKPMAMKPLSETASAPVPLAPISAPMQPGPMRFTTAIPHPEFWFSDGTVVFEVENTLFKVHKFFFLRHSEFFRTLLGSRPPVAPPNVGHFKLSDVKKLDFERLLYVFYPTSLTSPDLTTVDDWTSVLTLAHKWQIQELKSLAIQKLGPLASPIDKIALARNFNLASFQINTLNVKQDWLLPAFTELCSKNSPLSLAQAEKLDMPTVVKIWEVQHEVLNWPGAYYGPQIMNLVKEKFDLE